MAKKKEKLQVSGILFAIYGAVMVYLLFIHGRTAPENTDYWLWVRQNCNFTPFYTVNFYWDILANKAHYLELWQSYEVYLYNARDAVVNLVGNVAMFIPLGYFLPKLSRKKRGFWGTILTGAGLILVVEVTQVLTLVGYCDVDDLILNMAGVILGYCLWKLRKK